MKNKSEIEVFKKAALCRNFELNVFKYIQNKKINILYICPDPTMVTPIQAKRHKVVFNVLQEFTRSGLLNNIYLFSNKQIIKIIGEQSIANMYNMINIQIANAVENVEWFKAQEPVLGSAHTPKEISWWTI